MIGALLIGTPFFLFFGALSDRVGRKPVILLGLPARGADVLSDLFKGADLCRESGARRSGAKQAPSWSSPTRHAAAFSLIRSGRQSSRAAATRRRRFWQNAPVAVRKPGGCARSGSARAYRESATGPLLSLTAAMLGAGTQQYLSARRKPDRTSRHHYPLCADRRTPRPSIFRWSSLLLTLL